MNEGLRSDAGRTVFGPAVVKRISWPAVFAGLVVVMAIQLLLGLLGLSIGASTISPLQEQSPAQGIGIGAGVWLLVSTLIALFVGGWVAGRLSGVPRRLDTALHGVLAWGLATLATTYLLSSAIGNVVSGATGILGRGLAMLGSGAAGASQELVQEGREALQERGIDLTDVKNEVTQLLRETGKPELQPETLGATAERAGEQAKGTAEETARAPDTTGQEVGQLIDKLAKQADDTAAAADKEAIVNVLVARTDMTREQAAETVDQWQARITEARTQLEQAKQQAVVKARETGEQVASGVSRAAGWSVFLMAIGAAAAIFGGYVGAPREVLVRARA